MYVDLFNFTGFSGGHPHKRIYDNVMLRFEWELVSTLGNQFETGQRKVTDTT